MGFFDEEKNVQEYIKIAEGYDGTELIKVLQKYLPKNTTVLELGMGPGKDLDVLKQTYQATGSDNSQIFIDRYKKIRKSADVIVLDAISLNTNKIFDCIYSNKVLHHLTKDELKQSFLNQEKLLQKNGFLFHSFWYGDKEETHHGLRFIYYTEEGIKKVIGNNFEILEIRKYKEFEENDSFYIIAKRN